MTWNRFEFERLIRSTRVGNNSITNAPNELGLPNSYCLGSLQLLSVTNRRTTTTTVHKSPEKRQSRSLTFFCFLHIRLSPPSSWPACLPPMNAIRPADHRTEGQLTLFVHDANWIEIPKPLSELYWRCLINRMRYIWGCRARAHSKDHVAWQALSPTIHRFSANR